MSDANGRVVQDCADVAALDRDCALRMTRQDRDAALRRMACYCWWEHFIVSSSNATGFRDHAASFIDAALSAYDDRPLPEDVLRRHRELVGWADEAAKVGQDLRNQLLIVYRYVHKWHWDLARYLPSPWVDPETLDAEAAASAVRELVIALNGLAGDGRAQPSADIPPPMRCEHEETKVAIVRALVLAAEESALLVAEKAGFHSGVVRELESKYREEVEEIDAWENLLKNSGGQDAWCDLELRWHRSLHRKWAVVIEMHKSLVRVYSDAVEWRRRLHVSRTPEGRRLSGVCERMYEDSRKLARLTRRSGDIDGEARGFQLAALEEARWAHQELSAATAELEASESITSDNRNTEKVKYAQAVLDESAVAIEMMEALVAELQPEKPDLEPVTNITPRPRVILDGDVPFIEGRKKRTLRNERTKVIRTLLEAGASGLTEEELARKTGVGGPRKILVRLAEEDPDWKDVIVFPGQGRKGFRIQS